MDELSSVKPPTSMKLELEIELDIIEVDNKGDILNFSILVYLVLEYPMKCAPMEKQAHTPVDISPTVDDALL